MTPPIPRELAIRNRIVTVLSAIAAGETYWTTPARVMTRYVHWREYQGAYPLYMVTLGSGGQREYNSYHSVDETFEITIKGYVKDNADTSARILECWQDIRVALAAEMGSPDAAALPSLGVIQLLIKEPPDTDDGYLAIENGHGFFDVRVEIQFSDTLGYV